MILVTGATGQLGGATIEFLLENKVPASEISALVRDTAKGEALKKKGVELRQGDYTDYDSLVKAFKGVDKLLLVSSSDMNDRSGQHINAIKAAKEVGVKHLFYTSISRLNNQNSESFLIKAHIDTEAFLETAGITYTVLRNNFYSDVLPMLLGENVLETGVFFPGTGKVAYASRRDMAEATAKILTTEGHENKIYNFSGNTSYNLSDIAGILSKISGKEVSFTEASPEAYREQLRQYGVPDMMIDFTIDIGRIYDSGILNNPDTTLEDILGHKSETVEDSLRNTYIR